MRYNRLFGYARFSIDMHIVNRTPVLVEMAKCKSSSAVAILLFLLCLAASSVTLAHSPHDDIRVLAVSPEYSSDRTLFITLGNVNSVFWRLQKSIDGGSSWRELSNGLDNRSHLVSIAISPEFAVDETLFIGTAADGIFKSVDRGESWERNSEGLGLIGINFIEISPDYKSDQLVFAAPVGGGLFRSTNGGKTWSQGLERDVVITALGFYSDANRAHAWAADEQARLYSSSDSARTWRKLPGTTESAVQVIACEPVGTADCYVGTKSHGVLRTSNRGTSFVASNNGLPTNEQGEYEPITGLALSPDFATDSTMFASTWHNAVFQSRDRGKTWRKFDSGLTTHSQADIKSRPHFSKVSVSQMQSHATVFLAGFDGLFRSVDSGVSWSELETMSTGRVETIAISPGYVLDHTIAIVTQDGGAYISNDGGVNWTALNQGLEHTHLWDIEFSPQFKSDNMILAISNRDYYWSTEKRRVWESARLDRNKWTVRLGKLIGTNWPMVRFPLQIGVSRNFPQNEDIYVGTRYEGIYSSDDAGATWSQLRNSPTGWVSSLVMSPSYESDGTIFAAFVDRPTAPQGPKSASKIFKVRNSGRDWQQVGGDFDGVLAQHGNAEIQLAVSPNYVVDQTIFVGTASGLFRSEDAGNRWTKITQVETVSDGYIRSIGISPNYGDDRIVYIGLKGKGLHKSIDKGATFFRVSNDAISNSYDFEFLAVSPGFDLDDTIFGSANGEVLKSTNGGKTWSVMSRLVRYEDRNSVISFDGQWEAVKSSQFSASTSKFAVNRGSRATLNFVGSGIIWLGSKSDDQGVANVYIDGDLIQSVDQYSEVLESIQEVFEISGLEKGPHTIMVEVDGSKNPRSGGVKIDVDAFDVLP